MCCRQTPGVGSPPALWAAGSLASPAEPQALRRAAWSCLTSTGSGRRGSIQSCPVLLSPCRAALAAAGHALLMRIPPEEGSLNPASPGTNQPASEEGRRWGGAGWGGAEGVRRPVHPFEGRAPGRSTSSSKPPRNLLILNRNVSKHSEAKQSLSAGQVGINGRGKIAASRRPLLQNPSMSQRTPAALEEAETGWISWLQGACRV